MWSFMSFKLFGKYKSYLPMVSHRAGHVRILIEVAQYAHIEEMSRIFKNPLEFSRIIPYFQFLDDFISRVFINIVFCRFSALDEAFNFLLKTHFSFFKMAESKKRKRLTACDSSWEKDFPIGPASQNKHAFYCHPCQKVISCGHMRGCCSPL